MAQNINEVKWRAALREPDWYLRLSDDFKELEKRSEELSKEERKVAKGQAYSLVEEALEARSLPLDAAGEDLDKQRQSVDTIVIHHTKNPPGMKLSRLNAMQLLRIYGSYYAHPTDQREKHFKGQPVWSNHFYKGQPVFWGYHWLIRTNGTAEHLLEDDKIGWHAGNWDVNCRSIAICIDDDLTDKVPTDEALVAVAQLIKAQYQSIKSANIVGHADINPRTVCPGNLFKSDWRPKILAHI